MKQKPEFMGFQKGHSKKSLMRRRSMKRLSDEFQSNEYTRIQTDQIETDLDKYRPYEKIAHGSDRAH